MENEDNGQANNQMYGNQQMYANQQQNNNQMFANQQQYDYGNECCCPC